MSACRPATCELLQVLLHRGGLPGHFPYGNRECRSLRPLAPNSTMVYFDKPIRTVPVSHIKCVAIRLTAAAALTRRRPTIRFVSFASIRASASSRSFTALVVLFSLFFFSVRF